MPYLGDYLGQLMAEIAIARMQADFETVRLAEIYASHPLLKVMAVPRLRLPEVNLELPVLIKESEAAQPGEPARGGVKLADLRARFDDVLSSQLETAGVVLSAADRRELNATLDDRLRAHGALDESVEEVYQVADELAAESVRFVEERQRRLALEPHIALRLGADITSAVRLEFPKVRTTPPRLVALVTTAEIQAVDSPESITRLRIKLTEQGFEWTTIESDGVSRDRLVPE